MIFLKVFHKILDKKNEEILLHWQASLNKCGLSYWGLHRVKTSWTANSGKND